MPKLKTRKSVAKRFKITKKGKVKRQKACRGHLLAKKTRKRKRLLRKSGLVSKASERTIKRMLAH